MADNKWIRIFDIPETSIHRKGFTLYRIISMLYPQSNPDAIIKITVWKRYNEIKRLHKEIRSKYRALRLKKEFPKLPRSAYFKRFNSDVIKDRLNSTLSFLDFVADISELYTSMEFVNFFKTSQTPVDIATNSTIGAIRTGLNLPEEPEYSPFNVTAIQNSSDDDCTISDTDSAISTLQTLDSVSNSKSSLSLRNSNSVDTASKAASSDSHDSISISTTTMSNESAQTEVENFYASIGRKISEYIIDASHHINLAVQYESDHKYEEAFNEYKTGIDIMVINSKLDKNQDRIQMVRFQIDKYLLRAEKIFNLHLSNEMRSIRELTSKYDYNDVGKSLNDLEKYKVLKVIGGGMLALHTEYQKLYYIKVVQKTTIFSYDDLILPDDVPFMIRLENYYVSENAIFLILDYCEGTKLSEYIRTKCKNTSSHFYNSVDNRVCASSSSDENDDDIDEGSYVDLINEYKTLKRSESYDEERDKNNKTESSKQSNRTKDDVDCSGEDVPVEEEEEEEEAMEAKEIAIISSRKSSISRNSLAACNNADDDFTELLPVEQVVKWTAQLLLALEKLLMLGVVCNNLNIDDLMINEKGDIALTYQCKVAGNCLMKRNNFCNFHQHDLGRFVKATSLWNFGLILYELLVGMPLVQTHPQGISPYCLLYIPKYVSAEGRSLLKQLLSYEIMEGGLNGIQDIKVHPFYGSVSWESA